MLSIVQNLISIGQGVSVRRTSEKCMFPSESEVVLNIVWRCRAHSNSANICLTLQGQRPIAVAKIAVNSQTSIKLATDKGFAAVSNKLAGKHERLLLQTSALDAVPTLYIHSATAEMVLRPTTIICT